MSACVVWIDNENAKLFMLQPQGSSEQKLHSKEVKRHSEKFFHEVAHAIHNDVKEILLVGPGLGKVHFKKHLEDHHHQNLSQRIVGVETCDHPTDKEILAQARKFFKGWDAFHESIG